MIKKNYKKKSVSKKLLLVIFSLFLATLFLANLSAAGCWIEANKATCESLEGHAIMRLSSTTNAHGELITGTTYSNVLCCDVGTGDTTCDGTNKILGLSSTTNAHAEIPSLDNYGTDVCYEDFDCIGTTSICGTGDASEHPLEVLSLSADTNAHLGGFNDYSSKICCSGGTIAEESCELTSAYWETSEAKEGVKVKLIVQGNTEACDNQAVSFEIYEDDLTGDTLVASSTGGDCNPDEEFCNTNFIEGELTARGVWTAEWQDDGLLGGDPEYYFVATLVSTEETIESDDELSVTEWSEEDCADINSCEDYTSEEECISDASLCGQAQLTGGGIVDCDAEDIICGCVWDENEGSCSFGFYEIDCGTPEEGCGYGCTLCRDAETGTYCNTGATCPSGDAPTTLPENSNGTCDFGIDGCLSNDCNDGDRDTCLLGTYCTLGKCWNLEGPLGLGNCKISQSIEKDCDEEPIGYKTIIWTGVWSGEGECGTSCQKCNAGGESTIPCPTQVQLPFFDYIQIIIAIGIIVIIYISLIIKRKILKKKPKRKISKNVKKKNSRRKKKKK